MGQIQDGTEAMEQHKDARAWLTFLIDHPDKTVSVAEYIAQLDAARKAVTVTHKARLASRG